MENAIVVKKLVEQEPHLHHNKIERLHRLDFIAVLLELAGFMTPQGIAFGVL